MPVFCVAIVQKKNTRQGEEIHLNHGIVNAISKEEALGIFLLKERVQDCVLSNQGVFEAIGYKYCPEPEAATGKGE